MATAHRSMPSFPPTTDALLQQAEALQAQAAELAAMISGADNDAGTGLIHGKGNAALAKGIIRARTERAKHLPRSLFADPAWDILLELYSAELAQRRIAVGELCAAAKVPTTTGLRWLTALEANHLIQRHTDPLDARRFFVSLTDSGAKAMESFFKGVKDALIAA
jgi:DNA-binding MarR family transcriptional regulator